MQDSGIDIDFSSLLNDDDIAPDGSYYKLKSKVIVGR